jgi:predicted glycoside hydrolase/deacetylase ChbG (UPF0249 family)
VTRIVIVNADDFGQTEGVNRGVIRAHEEGIVTSASLLVRFDAAQSAAAYARRRRELSVGLHVDLGEAVYSQGEWRLLYERGDTATEIAAQLERFRRLIGEDPTHLDSHQHAHRAEPARSIMLDLGERLGVPVRELTPHAAYVGGFYGQDTRGNPYPELISVDGLAALLRSLESGVTELGCHPGEAAGLDSPYGQERELEVETLCDPRVRETIEAEGIELRSFRNAFGATA